MVNKKYQYQFNLKIILEIILKILIFKMIQNNKMKIFISVRLLFIQFVRFLIFWEVYQIIEGI